MVIVIDQYYTGYNQSLKQLAPTTIPAYCVDREIIERGIKNCVKSSIAIAPVLNEIVKALVIERNNYSNTAA